VAQGQNSITLPSSVFTTGTNTLIVRVEDSDGNKRSLTYTVTVVDLVLRSTFDNSTAFVESEMESGAITFPYVPYGGSSLEKTVHFELDGTEIGTVTTKNSGKTMSYSISRPTHGSHILRVWMTAVVNSQTITSNELYYDFAYIRSNGSAIVIASDFNETSIVEGNILSVPYLVYDPVALTASVSFAVQYEAINPDTGTTYWATFRTLGPYEVNRTQQTLNIREYPTGSIRIRITANHVSSGSSGGVTRDFVLTVAESDIDIAPLTANLSLDMDTAGRSSDESESIRGVWRDKVDTTVMATLSDFNWKTNGWILDDDGGTPLKISGEAEVTIPFYPFSRNAIGASGSGMTVDIDFMVDDIQNPNAVLLSCMTGNGPGFKITAEKIVFSSDLQSIETQIPAGERIKVTMVADDPQGMDKLLRMYTNGVSGSGSGVKAYTSDSMQQGSPVPITANGNGATLYIYAIRVYSIAHTGRDVVANEIAHYETVSEKAAAYYENEIYSAGSDAVDINALQEAAPGLTIVYLTGAAMPSAKINTDGSVSKTGTVLSGQIIDPDNELCCSFENMTWEIQGTSSAAYFRKNYRGRFNNVIKSNGEEASGYAIKSGLLRAKKITFKKDVASSEQGNNTLLASYYNEICPYQTPPQEIDSRIRQGIDGKPCAMFFACTDPNSPEYNNGQPQFYGKYNMNIDKGADNVFGFGLEDENDEPLYPLAQSWEFRNNTSDRCLFRSADFISKDSNGSFSWLNDFEARYGPGEDEEDTTQLAALFAWIVSTNPDAATGNALATPYTVTKMMANAVVYETWVDENDNNAVKNVTVTDGNGFTRKVVTSSRFETETITVSGETYTVMPIDASGNEIYRHSTDTATYREDKFYAEFEDHFVKQDVIFYYIFTEYFLMIDNRAKNMFITSYDGTHWLFLPYDMDTAIGINNEGELAFGYGLELADQIGTSHVSNDQGRSVLWNNVEATMQAEISAMFSEMETAGYFNPEIINTRYVNHQGQWPMNLWNEDQDWAYGVPHRNGDDTYLPMWQGNKALQRYWWLKHRHVYICSKYQSASALNDNILLRTYTPGAGTASLEYVPASGDMAITPWQDVYVAIKWGSYLVTRRSTAGTITIMQKPAGVGSLNDTETYVYSASAIKDIGDLSPLYVGQCDVHNAIHLEQLILGSELEGYENTNCTSVVVGNNRCMKKVDVRGLTSLAGALNLSGCENIREVYAERTALTSVELPNGGYLETLHLPDTVTKLTLLNQEYLAELEYNDLSSVTRLNIENCPYLDLKDILSECTNLQFARLIDVDWTEEDSTNLEKLLACHGIDESDNTTTGAATVTGSVYVETIDGDILSQLRSAFPYLTITYGSAGVTLYFKNAANDDGEAGKLWVKDVETPITCASSTPGSPEENDYWYDTANSTLYKYNGSSWVAASQEISYSGSRPEDPDTGDWWYDSTNSLLYQCAEQYRQLLAFGDTGHYPYDASHSEIAAPTLKSTARYSYTFTGWSGSITSVTASRNITATYSKTTRQYGVTWKNGSTVLGYGTDGSDVSDGANIPYGTTVEWAGNTPTYSGAESDMVFAGWNFKNIDDDNVETVGASDALTYTVKGTTIAEASFIQLTVPATVKTFAECTWGEIIALCKAAYDGTLQTKTGYATLQAYGWAVGNENTITLKSGEEVTLKIWGFDINVDEDNHTLPVTIGTKYSLVDTRAMNASAKQLYGYGISADNGNAAVTATTMNTTYNNTHGAGNITIEFTKRTYLNNILVTDGTKTFRYYLTGARSLENLANRMDVNYLAQEDATGFTARAGKVEIDDQITFSYENANGDTGSIILDGTEGVIKIFDRALSTATSNDYRAIEFMPGSKIIIPMENDGQIVITGRALYNGGGYKESELRAWLTGTFIDQLPAIIQQRATGVKRVTQIGGLDWDTFDTCYDKVFIPTMRELNFSNATTHPYCDENNTPFPTFATAAVRTLLTYPGGDQSKAVRAWTSSATSGSVNYFVNVNLDGSYNSSNANNRYGVAFGFCVI
jgi:hypothetical protein